MKKRILVLMHPDLVPPKSLRGQPQSAINNWKTEYDVITTLRKLGHEVKSLGVQEELLPIRGAVTSWQPHVVFNLLEEFHGDALLDQHVASYLELLKVPYTGNNPRGLVLSRDKALAKKILSYHGVLVPRFMVVRRGQRARVPSDFPYPAIVKSLVEHASLGLTGKSVVRSPRSLSSQVERVHDYVGTDAIVEEYVPGRELYVGVIGNRRLQVLPPWELLFERMPTNQPHIATEKVKHDPATQDRWGIYQQAAQGLDERTERQIVRLCKEIYHHLELEGYARIDFRLRDDGRLFFLEANPNPEIAVREEFASAAAFAGLRYPDLLQKLVNLGISRGRAANRR